MTDESDSDADGGIEREEKEIFDHITESCTNIHPLDTVQPFNLCQSLPIEEGNQKDPSDSVPVSIAYEIMLRCDQAMSLLMWQELADIEFAMEIVVKCMTLLAEVGAPSSRPTDEFQKDRPKMLSGVVHGCKDNFIQVEQRTRESLREPIFAAVNGTATGEYLDLSASSKHSVEDVFMFTVAYAKLFMLRAAYVTIMVNMAGCVCCKDMYMVCVSGRFAKTDSMVA